MEKNNGENVRYFKSHSSIYIYWLYILCYVQNAQTRQRTCKKRKELRHLIHLAMSDRLLFIHDVARKTIKNGWASMPNLQTKYSILSIFHYMFLYMQVFLYLIIALFRDLMVHIKYLLNHQHNQYTD